MRRGRLYRVAGLVPFAAAALVIATASASAGASPDGDTAPPGSGGTASASGLAAVGPFVEVESLAADDTIRIADWSRAAEDELSQWISPIYDVVGSDPGYGDIGVNYREMSIEVYFHGEFPSTITPVRAAAAEAGVKITKIDVDYGQDAFDHIAEKLADIIDNSGIVGVTAIGPSRDFSHLEVKGPTLATDAELQQRITAILRNITDIPIAFENGVSNVATGRQDDRPAFKGGARINIVGASFCTSGLPMSTSTNNYLLTAAHCTGWQNYYTFKTGDNVKTIGQNSWTDLLSGTANRLDATLIHSDARTPLIYYGAYNTGTTVSIDDAKPWAQSLTGCLSGSVSGTRCNVKRDGTATQLVQLCVGPTCKWQYAFFVEPASAPNSQIVAGGDSGAPWYEHLSASQSALGIQSGAPPTSIVPCGSNVDPSVSVTCYSRASVTPINRIVDALDSYNIDVTASF